MKTAFWCKNSDWTSFYTEKLKQLTIGTRSKTQFWLEGDFEHDLAPGWTHKYINFSLFLMFKRLYLRIGHQHHGHAHTLSFENHWLSIAEGMSCCQSMNRWPPPLIHCLGRNGRHLERSMQFHIPAGHTPPELYSESSLCHKLFATSHHDGPLPCQSIHPYCWPAGLPNFLWSQIN